MRYGCDHGLPNGETKPLPAPGDMRRCLDDPECTEAFIVAHRGNRQRGAPENSLQSLRDTAAAGIPMAEVDVRTTADGVMVLMHDPTIDRTTNATGEVKELTWDVLKHAVLNANGDTTHSVPTFEDAMQLASELGIGLYLDIKNVDDEALIETIQRHNAHDWALIRTSDVQRLQAFHALDPSVWTFLGVDSLDDALQARATEPTVMLVEIGWSAPLSLATSLRDEGFQIQQDVMAVGDTLWRAKKSMLGWLDRRHAGAQLLQTDLPSELNRALCLDDAGWVETPSP